MRVQRWLGRLGSCVIGMFGDVERKIKPLSHWTKYPLTPTNPHSMTLQKSRVFIGCSSDRQCTTPGWTPWISPFFWRDAVISVAVPDVSAQIAMKLETLQLHSVEFERERQVKDIKKSTCHNIISALHAAFYCSRFYGQLLTLNMTRQKRKRQTHHLAKWRESITYF